MPSLAEFAGTNLSGVSLAGASLDGEFSGANLTGADLAETFWLFYDFSGANVCGADLTGATWSLTEIWDGVIWDDATIWPEHRPPVSDEFKR